jgi:hypothetical protein
MPPFKKKFNPKQYGKGDEDVDQKENMPGSTKNISKGKNNPKIQVTDGKRN